MPIPAGYAQANIKFVGAGYPTGAEVTLGLAVSGYSGDPNEAALDVYGFWQANILEVQSSDCSLATVLVKFGPDSTGPSGEYGVTVAGGNSATCEAPQVACLVQKYTDFGGKAGRGRWYLPGLIKGAVLDGGLMSSDTAAAFQSGITDFRNDLITAGLIPVLLHGEGSPLTTPSPIQSMVVASRCATQRRRNRR